RGFAAAIERALPQGSRVGLLGLTFKAGTADTRESPAVALARQLLHAGLAVSAYDPALRDLPEEPEIQVRAAIGEACDAVDPVVAALLLQLALRTEPAAAATGDLTADVVVPDTYPTQVAPSVAFDGHYLYYLGYGSPVLNRIDVPPAGGTQQATGRVQTPITG